jgi:Uma2 family endonuclease
MNRLSSLSQRAKGKAKRPSLPPLENGDHLDQKTFHERYEAMPEGVKAELIGGIVFLSSPQKLPHGKMHNAVLRWLFAYEDATPQVSVLNNDTTILGPDSEPQPDSGLIITAEGHRQTREENEYAVGAPELVVEVAQSTAAIDLGLKRQDYEQAGVREYIVVTKAPPRVLWLILRQGKLVKLPPGPDGILRSEVFPGLWLDAAALLRHDKQRVKAVLQQGLATPEHAAFVKALAPKRGRKPRSRGH